MTSYDNNAQQPTYDLQSNSGVVDKIYLKSMNGILKVVQLALDLIVFICAVVWTDFVRKYGGGWVQFVSMSGLILTVILYTLYVFQVQRKLAKIMPAKAPWDLCETCFNGVYAVFYLVSGIVSAVYGDKHSSIGASAFFCFAAMIAYGIDTFLCYRRYRNFVPPPSATPSGGSQAPPTGDSRGGPQY